MGRPPRITEGGFVYYCVARALGDAVLFPDSTACDLFKAILEESLEKWEPRVLAFAILPTQWHILAIPRKDGDLSKWMAWIMSVHAMRSSARRVGMSAISVVSDDAQSDSSQGNVCRANGSGADSLGDRGPADCESSSKKMYERRFKSFPVQETERLLEIIAWIDHLANEGLRQHANIYSSSPGKTAGSHESSSVRSENKSSNLGPRNVETMAIESEPTIIVDESPDVLQIEESGLNLVLMGRSSLLHHSGVERISWISSPPVALPSNWRELSLSILSDEVRKRIQQSLDRGTPYGDSAWVERIAKRFQLESTLRPRGRPAKNKPTQ